MKYLFYPLLTLLTVMLAACSQDVVEEMDPNIPDSQKQEIAFSLSNAGGAFTRAVGLTRAGFTSETQIVARFESFKSSTVGGTPDVSNKRSTRTILVAQPQATGKDYSLVNYLQPSGTPTLYKRYWDDAFGRYGNISVYAVAVPGKTHAIENDATTLLEHINYGGVNVSSNIPNWKKEDGSNTSNNNITWTVTKGTAGSSTDGTIVPSTGQDGATIENEDLCYSNNIQTDNTLGKYGRYVYDFTSNKYPDYSGVAVDHKDGHLRLALKNSTDKTTEGHFDKGHLIFRHALTRLTVNLKEGAGFNTSSDGDFKFTGLTNMKVYGVPVSNTLNIKEGKWESSPTTGNIERMHELATASGYNHTLRAQFIPGYVFTENDATNVLEYSIDDNTYYITQGMIYKALAEAKAADGTLLNQGEIETINSKYAIQMKQGKNYVINITVNKTAIANVTATLVGWEYVKTDEVEAHNSYITLSIMDKTDKPCNNFDLYRADDPESNPYTSGDVPVRTNWFKHYTDTDKATLSGPTTAGVWTTNWFWESNKSFYHFRTVNQGVSINPGAETTDPKDYFSVTSGQLADANDYHWGAPMKSGVTMKYDVNKGFNDFLYPAIGSTTYQINIIEHHMMSNIHIVLHTDTKTDETNHKLIVAENGVYLSNSTSQTTVELNRFYKDGTVEMARGVVNPAANSTSLTATASINAPSTYYPKADIVIGETTYNVDNVGETNKYSYRIVPQVLNRGTTPTDADKIGLTITTPDGNKYFVPELALITAVTGTNTQHHKADEAVTRWYPGYDYTYHIRLHKTGIESITCSIVDWIKVETGSIDIGL